MGYIRVNRPYYIMKSVLSEDNTSSNPRKPHPKSSCSKKDRSERTEFHAIPEPPLIPRQHQTTLQWAPTGPNVTDSRKNIPPAGDSIVQRKLNDGIFRVASNNIDGSTFNKGGFDIAQDISVSDELGIDVMALQETKVPWTGANRRLYDMQTKLMWPTGAKTAFSSAPWEHGDST